MMYTLQIRPVGAGDYGTLWNGYETYAAASTARSRWHDNYTPFRDASFRILGPDGKVATK